MNLLRSSYIFATHPNQMVQKITAERYTNIINMQERVKMKYQNKGWKN